MGTITLHHGTGAQDFDLNGESLEPEETRRVFLNARRLLTARSHNDAIYLLDSAQFAIFHARNHFGDDFHVLYAEVPLVEYEAFQAKRRAWRKPARELAEVIPEAGGPDIRFLAVGLILSDPETWDVFLCHASEDKAAIAKPLFEHLESTGIRCWYDEAEIAWGDSIVSRIQQGLNCARFVIVILSPAFLAKDWPQKELRTALTLEIEGRGSAVLPLLAGDPTRLLASMPFVREKRYILWTGDPALVEKELRVLLRRAPQ